jgi:hypothetical protein
MHHALSSGAMNEGKKRNEKRKKQSRRKSHDTRKIQSEYRPVSVAAVDEPRV